MQELMIFEGHEVEVLELEGQVLFNPYHVGACLDIGENGVKTAVSKMNDKQAVKLTNSKVAKYNFRKLHNTGENFLTESGVYKLVFKSHKPNAETFTDWIADEVLPSIRKTGSYETDRRPACIEDVLIQSLQEMKDIRAKVDRQSVEMKAVKDAMTAPATEEKFSEWVSKTVGNIASSPEYADNPFRYQTAWGESYKRLQDKASCRLDVLLKNAKKRAEENGASKSKVKAISKLSVIEADKRLKALYIGVLQEMSVAYCVEVV